MTHSGYISEHVIHLTARPYLLKFFQIAVRLSPSPQVFLPSDSRYGEVSLSVWVEVSGIHCEELPVRGGIILSIVLGYKLWSMQNSAPIGCCSSPLNISGAFATR